MSKFRILSIFLAVGLLVGALGVGPVLAGQIDVTGLDTQDASYAPAALAVAENQVEWTTSGGDDVKYVAQTDTVYFHIKDDALQTVSKPQIALWDVGKQQDGTLNNAVQFRTTGEAQGFNLLTGNVGASGNVPTTFTLTGEPDGDKDTVGSSGGHLDGNGEPNGLVSGNARFAPVPQYANEWFATTTFVMFNNATKWNVDGGNNNLDIPVYGSEVATTTVGTSVVIKGGHAAGRPIHAVSSFDAFNSGETPATSTLKSQAVVALENDIVKILGGTEGNYQRVKITFTHHHRDIWESDAASTRRARVVSTSDPQGEYVTIMEVGGVGDKDANSISNIFLGEITLSDNSSDRGPGGADEQKVWVQDGDTLTVQYLDKDGDIVDSDSITVDAAKPTISGVEPAAGTNTDVGNPTLQFTATDTGSGIPIKNVDTYFDVYIGTTLDSDGKLMTLTQAVGAKKVGDPQDGKKIDADDLAFVATENGYRVIFSSPTSWVSRFSEVSDSEAFHVTLRARDLAGNQAATTFKLTIDDSNPTASSAKTGVAWDSANEKEKGGVANGVRLVMSEAIDPNSVQASDFEVGNEAPTAAVVGEGSGKDSEGTPYAEIIYLTMANDLAPDATPKVEVVGTVSDLSGNSVDTTIASADEVAEDGLDPTVTVSRDVALLAKKGDEVVISIASNEKVKAGGVTVTVQGPDGSNANVAPTGAKAGEPLQFSLTRTVGSADKTGAYGVSVKITDLSDNDGYSASKASNEEVAAKNVSVSGSKVTITVANGPIADGDVDGDLTDGITVALMDENGDSVATSTEVTVTEVEASEQKITVTANSGVNVSGAHTAVVSYSYAPADHTFEIDMSAPGVKIEYGGAALDKASVPNSSPFINVKFDDAESHPSDGYKDVDLTSAMLTGPDGTETDIENDFAANANGHDWLWAGVGLALGDYKLAVSGTDTAGNTGSMTVNFKIVKKPATKIALSPGQNLISLPGSPATTSISGVLTNPAVTAALTYDPSSPTKWLAAERAPDGSWVGNLTEITGNLGYWVTTRNFEPIEVDIVSFTAGGTTLPPTHSLVPGWNLVPVTVLDETTKSVDANFYLGNNWIRAITYDAQDQSFKTLGPDDLIDGEGPKLQVGKGYFVWMTRPHTVVP